MKRVLLLGAALAIGLVAGRVARPESGGDPEESRSPASRVPAGAPHFSPEGDLGPADLLSTEPGPRSLPAETDRAALLRVRFSDLATACDGEGLLALVREALRAGPEAWPLVLEIFIRLDEVEDLRTFGLTRYHLERLSNTIYPAAAWALAHPSGLSQAALEAAIDSVGDRADEEDLEALKLLLEFSRSTPDDGLAGDAARSLDMAPAEWSADLEALLRARPFDDRALGSVLDRLVRYRSPGVDELLTELVHTYREREKTLRILLDLLADRGSPACVAIIGNLANDPRDAVRDEARFQLLRVRPPAPGILIGRCPASVPAAGLRRGDIVLEWQGVAITGDSQFRATTRAGPSSEHVPVAVLREGARVELSLSWDDFRGVSWNWTPSSR